MDSPTSLKDKRFATLDALRFVGALIVAINHFHSFGHDVFSFMASHGHGVMCVFFMISGHVLPYRYLCHGDGWSLLSSAVRRIPRMVVPVFCVSTVACVAARMGAFNSVHPAFVQAKQEWCENGVEGVCWTSDFQEGLRSGVKFLWTFDIPQFPCGVGWTLACEILGSYYIYLMAPVMRYLVLAKIEDDKSALKRAVALHGSVCIVLLSMSQWEAFCPQFFALLATRSLGLYHHGVGVPEEGSPGRDQVWRVLVCFQVGLATVHIRILAARNDRASQITPLVPKPQADHQRLLLSISLMLVGIAMTCLIPDVTRRTGELVVDWLMLGGILAFISAAIYPENAHGNVITCLQHLGRYSFSLYIWHATFLFALGLPIYQRIVSTVPEYMTFPICFGVCLLPMAVTVHFFHVYVEEPLGVRGPKLAIQQLQQNWKSHSPSTSNG